MLATLASDLPDPMVRAAPIATNAAAESYQQSTLVTAELTAAIDVHRRGHDHGAVYVELQLIPGTVADAHRTGAAVAFQVIERFLLYSRFPVYVIEDLQPRPGKPGGMQQPL
jgi:hypothetical protein